jgi:hypothetical protein
VEYSTNVLDTEVADSNLGGGTPIWLVCRVNTTFSGTSGTMIVALQDGSVSGTLNDKIISQTFTTVLLSKGADLLTIPLPVDHLRYLRMRYTPATGTGYTAGKIDAFLTLSAPRQT